LKLQLDPSASRHRLAHELGHVIGLPDLWQRPDRDRHLKLSSSFFCASAERQNEARKCRVFPGQAARFPPRPTGLFGPFDSASMMNLYPEQVCETDGPQPDESSLDPTPLDGSAASELYWTFFGWMPF